MAINNFKPFATAANANVMSQADWEGLPALLSGFTSGKAASAEVNKAIRQASFIAAALAQYTANKSGLDVLDDADLNGFITKMTTAFGKDFQALDATLTALAGLATGANKLPYFTGADTAAQTDLTQIGRDVIGQTTVANLLTYLHLERLDQDPSETRIWSPDRKSYIFVQNGIWGAYSINSPAGNIALQLASGGTGAKDAPGARTNLGLGNSATLNVGTTSGTVAAGNDSRIVNAVQHSEFTSGSGWVRFPDGTIIQRGVSISGSQGFPTTVSLPIPFTQPNFTVTTSYDTASNIANDCPAFATTPIGTTAFYLMSSRIGAGTGAGANWIAIGK
ncbi:TPA: phage tail protein [Escherichia coli]|nr:phage tail protein [Escherichia coli]HAO9143586.1 phage tail protein [Escherichia coli]HCO6507185.1 phage tail protein [Escherichia coli]HCO7019458.1 phage tail protein [Escherichia coli]HDP8037913.1 phage tail protein [Escherichia coli]